MKPQKGNRPIFVRCEPELRELIQEGAAEAPFNGNVSQFSRDALSTVANLRRLYGPRYNVVISELIDGAEAEKAIAA